MGDASKLAGINPLCGMLFEIEHAASPFYLGLDYDEDESDIDLGPF